MIAEQGYLLVFIILPLLFLPMPLSMVYVLPLVGIPVLFMTVILLLIVLIGQREVLDVRFDLKGLRIRRYPFFSSEVYDWKDIESIVMYRYYRPAYSFRSGSLYEYVALVRVKQRASMGLCRRLITRLSLVHLSVFCDDVLIFRYSGIQESKLYKYLCCMSPKETKIDTQFVDGSLAAYQRIKPVR
ncbi:MAG: hypothetical protein JXR40_08555 [Pontiellaceae bacterium]|nr:hypothetical protein [Pontiellaceae bacterium]